MRADAIFRFDNTFELWIPVIGGQDLVSGALGATYTFGSVRKGLILPGQGSSIYLATREELPYRAQIRKARDKNGTPLFSLGGDEYAMYINEVNPQYDAFGAVVGWNHILGRTLTIGIQERLDRLPSG